MWCVCVDITEISKVCSFCLVVWSWHVTVQSKHVACINTVLLSPTMRSGNVFGRVCLSVCLCPVWTLTFKSLNLENSFLVCRCIFRISIWSRLYIKVIGSRSPSHVENLDTREIHSFEGGRPSCTVMLFRLTFTKLGENKKHWFSFLSYIEKYTGKAAETALRQQKARSCNTCICRAQKSNDATSTTKQWIRGSWSWDKSTSHKNS